MKNILIILFVLLISGSATAQLSDWNTEGFETESRTLNIQGSVMSEFGLWIDGGSDAYVKSNDYVYGGSNAFVISGSGDPEKPFYSSVYTKQLDMSSSSSTAVNFKYFVKTKDGYGVENIAGVQRFSFDVSNDGGNTLRKCSNMAGAG